MLGPAVAAGKSVRFANSVDPERRLRVAYISGDLRLHSVAFFLEAALGARDRGRFDVRGYSTGHRADAMTARLRGLCDGWVEAADLSGDALVERLRTDRIDIAVDLAGHTTGGRVVALARRGAPVQVTYLGYPATTGVPGIDYRLVDSLTDPEGSEAMATERLGADRPLLCVLSRSGGCAAGVGIAPGRGRTRDIRLLQLDAEDIAGSAGCVGQRYEVGAGVAASDQEQGDGGCEHATPRGCGAWGARDR
jgi:hypothetical protein